MTENEQAVKLLSELLRLDTSNPPGNEEIAVQFLESVLNKEGIATEIHSPQPRRANLLARIKGKKGGEPVVLLGHLDVVPARDEGWIEPPFSGAVRDGMIYGRGAIDMKSQITCQLLAFIGLHRQGIVPEHDMVFLATADEEVSGKLGAEYMLHKVEDLQDASFVLSEGGCIVDEAGYGHAQVSVAEKKVCQFMIRARGTGGHGSMPLKDNANDKIVRASNRIISTRLPFRPTRIVSRYLNGLLKGKRIGKMMFSSLAEALHNKSFCNFVEDNPVFNALLRNTISLNMLKSGEKVNVIPTEATAYFDARILPDVKHDAFLDHVRRIAGREVEVLLVAKTESGASPFNTPYFSNMAKTVRAMRGNIPVLPFLTTGATDLRHFRSLGIPAYGFFPATFTRDEISAMHGVNERISVRTLEEGLKGTTEIVNFLASYAPGE